MTETSKKKRVLIVGLGSMGQKHLAAIKRGSAFEVAGVVDHNKTKWLVSYPCFQSIEEAVKELDIDAAIVAVSCEDHFICTSTLLSLSIPVLLEKPFVRAVKDAYALIGLSDTVPLMVGHSERYNPAYLALVDAIGHIGTVKRAEFIRTTASPRAPGERDVIYDLAVHDLDLAFSLFGREVMSLRVHSGECYYKNYVAFKLTFKLGVTTTIVADRVSNATERKCFLWGTKGVLKCDFLNKKLSMYMYSQNENELTSDSIINMEAVQLPVTDGDALEMEHRAFFIYIQKKEAPKEPLLCALHSVDICEKAHKYFKQNLNQAIQ